MTPGDDRNPDYEGDDQLAAEFVIGVLSADERRTAAQRIETDLDFCPARRCVAAAFVAAQCRL